MAKLLKGEDLKESHPAAPRKRRTLSSLIPGARPIHGDISSDGLVRHVVTAINNKKKENGDR